MTFKKPVIVVSKCLEFEAVRYDAKLIKSKTVEKLKPFVNFLPVCPEVEIGLGTPRKPVRIIKDPKTKVKKLVQPITEKDLSKEMTSFIDSFLNSLKEVDGFILKESSPTSGLYNVKQYLGDDKKSSVVTGSGFFGEEVLKRYYTTTAIESEKRLNNEILRELFFIKVFTFRDYRDAISSKKIKALQDFHAKNKFLFLVYNQSNFRKMGKLIASYDKKNYPQIVEEYSKLFYASFKKYPTENSFINVLEHMFGYFKNKLDAQEKNHFLEIIEKYRDLRVPLSVPLKLIESFALRFKEKYILSQTILNPYPKKLIFKGF